ncbi:hypothetical protein L6164_013182 [Bauhinia variegata]|uniref:Uncharacterized protein n=1 Tax=Bauhinia variegata TaxID=167791 RepID=A0ACB9PCM4_BAUVA|nr:hypothetical protein L6164_013182 [Bauhinia variegata]
MNLIEMWGYCAEPKHRLLVYEYMENGSLAGNLMSNTLDWKKMYDISLGMARGLAYLHEECLDWILHCDIKSQNILLDSNYQPKIADFGLYKLQNRNNLNNSSFSMIRGTRDDNWKELNNGFQNVSGVEEPHGRLVTWVREKRNQRFEMASWVEEIIAPVIEANYDINIMETLASVALDCVEEDRDSRPTMSQVVELLQSIDNDS